MDEVVEAEAELSQGWWQSRTSAQLHDMARGGLAAGEFGAGAHREIERRARERLRLEQVEADQKVRRAKGVRISILGAVEIAMLIVFGALLLLG
jgi:hypothetical protein